MAAAEASRPSHPFDGGLSRRLVAVAGPTGIGKTALAARLAGRFPLEVVSVDSRQVYRRMDIGTAKPDARLRQILPHRLIDVADPDEVYSSGRFAVEAREAVAQIRGAGRVPLLVGGTGLYLRALAEGILTAPPGDPATRAALQAEARETGSPALHRRLESIDPASARRIHPNDALRVVRALEVAEVTGRPPSLLAGERAPCLPVTVVVLDIDRGALYRRLDRRVEEMLEAGFLEEVRSLLAAGYHEGLRSMQGIGYRELAAVARETVSIAEAAEVIRRETRNLAKRQLTWFRGMAGARWVTLPPGGDLDGALDVVGRLIEAAEEEA